MKWIRPDMMTIGEHREVTTNAVVCDELVEAWLGLIGETPWTVLVDECNDYQFDAGGICKSDEPICRTEISGIEWSVMLRHADVFPGTLREEMTHLPEIGPHVWVKGFRVSAILTVDIGEKLAVWMENEASSRVGEADQLWAEHNAAAAKAGMYVPPRRVLA